MPRSRPGWPIDLLLGLMILGAALIVPRWIDGQAALDWTRFHAREAKLGRGRPARRAAEQAGLAAARAIERAAPLPPAREAARVVLDLGKALEPSDPEAASRAQRQLATALDRASASWIGGLGLRALAAEAHERGEVGSDREGRPDW